MQSSPNRFQHGFGLRRPFVIPESQYAKTLLLQPCITLGIVILCIGMLPAVKLDDQLLIKAYEVSNVAANRLLATELEAGESFGA